MTFNQFLDVMKGNIPFTVGTEFGMSWILYYDGENKIEIPEYLLDRKVENIYPRDERSSIVIDGYEIRCALKAGLAIIVEGTESGAI